MKKVLILEEGPGFGGALMSLKCLLDNWKDRNYIFYVITNYPQNYIQSNNYIKKVVQIPRKRIYGPNSKLEFYLYKMIGNKSGPVAYIVDRVTFCNSYVNKLVRFIRTNKINLVHLNNWPLLNDGGVFAAKKANVPVLMHVRGMEYKSRLISWITKKADHIIAISEYIKKEIESLGVKERKISVVRNAVDFDFFSYNSDGSKFKKHYGINDDFSLIGIVGCLVDWKGHMFFLEACAELFKNVPVRAVIIGDSPDGNQSYKARLLKYAEKLGISDKIYFVGHVKNVAEAMAACSVLVHASTEPEPFGRVIIEAMALSKPVVATSPGGPSEIIQNKVDGLLIKPRDSLAMAEAINSILSNKQFSKQLGYNAHLKIVNQYNADIYVNGVLKAYQEILNA
ncbi:MAG: glycosyltransferase family 4 protein [Desulfobacter sp.]|nr:MAG: glycosyltransferase family 4 protein [Desulfobacter sp.]